MKDLKKYPNDCTRCGMCCIAEPCPISLQLGLFDGFICQALDFGNKASDVATCKLAYTMADRIGIGHGCCIKARAFKNGIQYDFAMLDADKKRRAACDVYVRRLVEIQLILKMEGDKENVTYCKNRNAD